MKLSLGILHSSSAQLSLQMSRPGIAVEFQYENRQLDAEHILHPIRFVSSKFLRLSPSASLTFHSSRTDSGYCRQAFVPRNSWAIIAHGMNEKRTAIQPARTDAVSRQSPL
jgi:hypothetical protein